MYSGTEVDPGLVTSHYLSIHGSFHQRLMSEMNSITYMYSTINHIAYFDPLQNILSRDTVEVVKTAGLKLSGIFILGY